MIKSTPHKAIDPGAFLILACLALAFSSLFGRLVAYGWDKADYTHGFFILPIAAFLIYRQKAAIQPAEQFSPAAALLFAAGLAVYVFAAINRFLFLEAFSFCLLVWGIFALRFSGQSMKALTFPLAYLLFLVPPPALAIDALTLPLKKISTAGSYLLLKVFQIPVKSYGAILEVKEYQLFVADACSGFRSLTTLLALGAVYAYFQNTSVVKRWIIFLSIVPLGIISNILRLTLTGVISYHFGHDYAEGFFHTFSGVLLFLLTISGLILVSEFLGARRGKHA